MKKHIENFLNSLERELKRNPYKSNWYGTTCWKFWRKAVKAGWKYGNVFAPTFWTESDIARFRREPQD